MSFIASILGSMPTSSPDAPTKSTLTPEEERRFNGNCGIGTVVGIITANLLSKAGICLNNIVPSSIQKIVDVNNAITANFLFKPFFSLLPERLIDPADTIIAAPIVEEFKYRFLFQEVLLRRIPKMILNKCAPEYVHLVDATPTKIARVALSTLVFGLFHMGRSADHANQCLGSNYGFAVLGAGAWLGYLAEKTNGIGHPILQHMKINAFAYAFGLTRLPEF